MSGKGEYEEVSTNDDGRIDTEDDSRRAYALSAIMLLLFSCLILAAHANLQTTHFGGLGWKNTYVSASAVSIGGCVLALLFYACSDKMPSFFNFVIGFIVFVGGAMYFIGGVALMVNNGKVSACKTSNSGVNVCNQVRAFYIALPIFVFAESTILAMQIGSKIIDGEKARIGAQVIVLFIYGLCRAIFWYGFYQNKLNSAEKSAEAALMMLMFVCFVVFVFHAMCCNIEAKWFRVTTAVLMSVAALIYLISWAVISGQKNTGLGIIYNSTQTLNSAARLKLVTAPIFVFMETINLAVEVGYVN